MKFEDVCVGVIATCCAVGLKKLFDIDDKINQSNIQKEFLIQDISDLVKTMNSEETEK